MKRGLNRINPDCKESKDTTELKSTFGVVKRKFKAYNINRIGSIKHECEIPSKVIEDNDQEKE